MAQTGGIFSLSKVKDPHLYTTYFMKIDNVKFKRKVAYIAFLGGDDPIERLIFAKHLLASFPKTFITFYINNDYL